MISARASLISLLSTLLFLVCACHGGSDSANGQNGPKAGVKAATARVIYASLPVLRTFPARTEAMVAVSLSAKMPGYVKQVLVEEGTRVKKGQLLVVLDEKDVRARLAALKASRNAALDQKSALQARLAYARADFRRFETLLREDAATQAEYDRSRATYLALRDQVRAYSSRVREIDARISEARNQLSYVRITSPVNGWITSRLADPGTFVNPGVPFIKIDSRDKGVWLTAGIDESLLKVVHAGTPVQVTVPAMGLYLKTRISRVIPHVDPASHTFLAKVALPESVSRSGLFGRMRIQTGTMNAMLIPASSVVKRGAIEGVFTVDANRSLHWRVIKTGSAWIRDKAGTFTPASGTDTAAFVQVLSGLSPDEEIATSSLNELREGLRLE